MSEQFEDIVRRWVDDYQAINMTERVVLRDIDYLIDKVEKLQVALDTVRELAELSKEKLVLLERVLDDSEDIISFPINLDEA